MTYIYLMEQRVNLLTTAPKGTPDSYDRISPNGKPWKSSVLHHIGILRSNPKTQIHIQYKCAGKTLSYDIGAELLTVVRKPQKGSKTFTYRHFLVNIRKDGLASRLSICNNDEVAWIDSTFLPDRNHTEVLRLFEKVKVDGTRLNLVLRRVTKFGSKKKWKWFDTSAGLSADNPQKHVSYTGVDQKNKS
ncbi:uncharacterized protein LOC132726392 [Ruditapes philippinarum]|uniref:uncharacterized protein LOC132726392 n=1 Tax=Ruditapes philippinarum TaxID=129788 RepID=UPI00295B0B85|nr:uncharacterized protein LOC132726392 [Ruditapes philippinarum]